MALPYISRDIINKYFNAYIESQPVPNVYTFYGIITEILDMEEDVSRIMRFDIYMEYSDYTSYWELFHDFIVYVRLQQLVP
jgi:hypothetical protein